MIPENARQILRSTLLAGLGLVIAWTAVEAEEPPLPSYSNLHGMTGYIVTPTAYVLPDGSFRTGVFQIDKEWSYFLRGVSDNEAYFVAFGFLPRVELMVRLTRVPNDRVLIGANDSLDRMGSGRLQVLTEGRRRPAVSVGADDPQGTRKFHSIYGVASKRLPIPSGAVTGSFTIGYGTRIDDPPNATTYILNGGFGGLEIHLGTFLSGVLEFDGEKWNTSTRLALFQHLAAHLAFLNLETTSGGVSWTQRF